MVLKKKRKMSEEARRAAAERLAKAREQRQLNNPPKLSHVHPDVLAKPDDHPLSYKNVMSWIKYNREQLPGLRKNVRANAKGSIAKLADVEGYIRNLQTYIRIGTYVDMFYGADQEKKITLRTIVPAGNKYEDE
tara:strand:- start:5912 stop:6313 length:402 start_codon:yes stop_codon:yes gene_type:complete